MFRQVPEGNSVSILDPLADSLLEGFTSSLISENHFQRAFWGETLLVWPDSQMQQDRHLTPTLHQALERAEGGGGGGRGQTLTLTQVLGR